MSNSAMVSYTKISPNKNVPRNHVIDTITIHHMAGDLSVEKCGEIFANKNRQASSNYGIGSDGRVALYVEEKDRAWTSGSRQNDNRAVTIEVANNNTKTWSVSDQAYESLIRLCVDICKRNGIAELVWNNNKEARVNHTCGANMTVHRDFQATACPGDWLYSRMGEIAEKVNEALNGKPLPKVLPEVPNPTIRKGNKGDRPLMLQQCLNYLGANLDEDGIFGALSTAALKDFQRRYGLVVDGIYGAKSYAKMKEVIK